MTITPFLSPQGVISYIVENKINQEIAIIDPSVETVQNLIKFIKSKNLQPKYILDTHTHADFLSARSICKTIYPKSLVGMSEKSPAKNLDLKLSDGQSLELGNILIQAIYAPGHTDDEVNFYIKNNETVGVLFTGDTLFIEGTGRTDFPGGSSEKLYSTLEKIIKLPDETVIYPGHNYVGKTKTTLAQEKINNKRLKLICEGRKTEFLELMNSHNPSAPDLLEESLKWNKSI